MKTIWERITSDDERSKWCSDDVKIDVRIADWWVELQMMYRFDQASLGWKVSNLVESGRLGECTYLRRRLIWVISMPVTSARQSEMTVGFRWASVGKTLNVPSIFREYSVWIIFAVRVSHDECWKALLLERRWFRDAPGCRWIGCETNTENGWILLEFGGHRILGTSETVRGSRRMPEE